MSFYRSLKYIFLIPMIVVRIVGGGIWVPPADTLLGIIYWAVTQ